MQRLPELIIGRSRWLLPVAERSADALAEAILSGESAESAAVLAEQLSIDPPLVLWTILATTSDDDRCAPQSIEDLARWLAGHALEALQWPADGAPPKIASDKADRDRYADLVADRLALADTAALLAVGRGQPAAELAYLAAMVHDARQWLTRAAGTRGTPKADSIKLPRCLEELNQTSAAAHVREAVEVLAGDTPAEEVDFDRQACRVRAVEGRRMWLEPSDGLGNRLPILTARLSRLAGLEGDFARTLLEEKLAAMAEFAAGAGHEINNPLAIIGGRAQLLLKDEPDHERRRELAVIYAQVRRAHEMIADMRLFARPPQPEPHSIDLVELIDSLVADLSDDMQHQATSLRRSGSDEPLEIEADAVQLQVALRAMCKNSLEAIGHNGNIEISVTRSGDNVRIRVTDDGPGITPDQRRHLFDPFYSARQAGRGLGLGLSKCWRIVTNHGGRIDVASEPGEGAEFTVTLPCRFQSSEG